MPWNTPSLRQVRERVRDDITGMLSGAAVVGNTVLRVMADANAGLTHLTLKYIDWLALQLMPDTAEHEWLDRHGDIWLKNSDGSTGRKDATYATGTVTMTGVEGTLVPVGTTLSGGDVSFETTAEVTVSPTPSEVLVRAIDAGTVGNLDTGTSITVGTFIPGLDTDVVVASLGGGTDTETDADLRIRVLRRIQQPPQGGAAHDYEAWALAVPGVTRAWCAPNEMGMGTVTVRFMMDVLRAEDDGFPTAYDVGIVQGYIDLMRPVAVKDIWVLAPIRQPVDAVIGNLVPDTTSVRNAIQANLEAMLFSHAAPGQAIYAAWKSQAIMEASGVQSFRLMVNTDDYMPSPGHMAVLGDIYYGGA